MKQTPKDCQLALKAKILSALIILSLTALPSPAYALRKQQAQNSQSGLEEIASAVGFPLPSTAGLEEWQPVRDGYKPQVRDRIRRTQPYGREYLVHGVERDTLITKVIEPDGSESLGEYQLSLQQMLTTQDWQFARSASTASDSSDPDQQESFLDDLLEALDDSWWDDEDDAAGLEEQGPVRDFLQGLPARSGNQPTVITRGLEERSAGLEYLSVTLERLGRVHRQAGREPGAVVEDLNGFSGLRLVGFEEEMPGFRLAAAQAQVGLEEIHAGSDRFQDWVFAVLFALSGLEEPALRAREGFEAFMAGLEDRDTSA